MARPSPHLGPSKLADLCIVNINDVRKRGIAIFIHTKFNKYCFFLCKISFMQYLLFLLIIVIIKRFYFFHFTLLHERFYAIYKTCTNTSMSRTHTKTEWCTRFDWNEKVVVFHRWLMGWRMLIGRCQRLTNLCCYQRIIGFGFQLYSGLIALGNYLSNRQIRKIASNSIRKKEKIPFWNLGSSTRACMQFAFN